MSYQESMNSANPGCIIVMIDQSEYMSDAYGIYGEKKKDLAAKSVNRLLSEIVEASSDGEEIKDRAFIGVIGYGSKTPGVELLLGDMISNIADNPKRVDKITKKISDGAGGLVEIEENFPVWIEPVTKWGTLMDHAFKRASQLAEDWCNSHPDSFPPLVINITSGKTNNELSARVEAEKLMQISNNDGNVLLFNVHISDGLRDAIVFPSNKNSFNDSSSDFLFDVSSQLPDRLRQESQCMWGTVETGARGMLYNGNAEDFIRLFSYGS